MRFTRTFTAGPAHIDELGHVNNAVWVQWMEDIAVAHWRALASPDDQAAYVWFITRHEIDYRGSLHEGETVTAETWVPEPPRGARFDRHIRFVDEAGKTLVEAKTTWAILDAATRRLLRVPRHFEALFLSPSS